MKIVHRISGNVTVMMKETLRSMGFDVDTGLSTLEVEESDARWDTIKNYASEWGFVDITSTDFTIDELKHADWLKMGPAWHHGYPQPEDDFGYLERTYDLSRYCSKCGIEKKQRSPFRFKREPRWGKRHILQLNWVFDEFFVLPEVWESVFKPLDVPSSPVIDDRSGRELENVVQLNVRAIAEAATGLVNHPSEVCASCTARKHSPFVRDFFPAPTSYPDRHMFKTREYFGAGASAFRCVIVSSALWGEFCKNKLQGAEFVPLAQ